MADAPDSVWSGASAFLWKGSGDEPWKFGYYGRTPLQTRHWRDAWLAVFGVKPGVYWCDVARKNPAETADTKPTNTTKKADGAEDSNVKTAGSSLTATAQSLDTSTAANADTATTRTAKTDAQHHNLKTDV